jgi:MFS family permease
VRRTLRLSVIEGGLTQAFLNWTTGSVIVGYMLHLGASPTEIGLIGSVPMLAQLASPVAAWGAALLGRLKLLTALTALLGRGLWLLAAFLPLLGVPEAQRPAFIVLLVMVSSFFQASTATLWASWMGEVVPEGRRGRYFGFRTGVVGVVGMVANLGAGWLLDLLQAPLNFQVVLGVGVGAALLGVVLLLFHHEPQTPSARPGFRDIFYTPWQHPNFRRFLLFGIYWQAAVMLAAPFVFTYFLQHLKMSFTQIALWSAIASCTALLTTSFWGHVADRYGNKAVLAIGTTLAGTAMPVSWMLATATHLWPVWLSAAFDALAWGAIGPAIFNLALVSAPKDNRTAFIAVYSFATGVAGFVGGTLSGPLLLLLSRLEGELLGFTWTGFHSLFLLSGALRMQAWRLLKPVEETNAWRTRDVLRQVRFAWRGIGFPWR